MVPAQGLGWGLAETNALQSTEAGLNTGDRDSAREKRRAQPRDVPVACCLPCWATRPWRHYHGPTPCVVPRESRAGRGSAPDGEGRAVTGWDGQRRRGPEAGLLGEELIWPVLPQTAPRPAAASTLGPGHTLFLSFNKRLSPSGQSTALAPHPVGLGSQVRGCLGLCEAGKGSGEPPARALQESSASRHGATWVTIKDEVPRPWHRLFPQNKCWGGGHCR